MAMTLGAIKRLELIKSHPEFRENLWKITRALQDGLREAGLDLGKTQSPVTPVFFKCPLEQVTQLIYDLRENFGIFCSVVIYPVVPWYVVLLRIIPTAVNTLYYVKYTVDAFKEIKRKVDNDLTPTRWLIFRYAHSSRTEILQSRLTEILLSRIIGANLIRNTR